MSHVKAVGNGKRLPGLGPLALLAGWLLDLTLMKPRRTGLAMIAFCMIFVPTRAWADSTDELVRQGIAAEQAGDEARAIRAFSEAITYRGTSEEAWERLALARERSGDAREARKVCDLGLERIPGSRRLLTTRAHIERSLGDWDAAKHDYRAVLFGGPNRRLDEVVLLGFTEVLRRSRSVLEELALWRFVRARCREASAVNDSNASEPPSPNPVDLEPRVLQATCELGERRIRALRVLSQGFDSVHLAPGAAERLPAERRSLARIDAQL
jgi:tetratricopeptide (TPR) repeat protein